MNTEIITEAPNEWWTPTFVLVPWVNEDPIDYELLKNKPDDLFTYYSKWDGSDGDITVTGTETLYADKYYDNVTINSWAYLYTNGFSLAVRWTLTNNGTIEHSGSNGSNAAWYVGWVGGTAINQGTLGVNLSGKKGWNGGDFATVNVPHENGVAGDNSNPSYANTNGVVGASGGNTSGWLLNNGWTGGIATRWVNYNVYLNIAQALAQLSMPTRNYNVLYNGLPSSGWSGGWEHQGYLTRWGWAGGSGSNWGIIVIHCNRYEWSWTIKVKWWAGWNGATGQNLGGGAGGWGWGGWSGWSGWVIFFTYTTGNAPTTDVTGWAGWTGGASIWFGWAGANGSTGTAGVDIIINK